MTMDKYIDAGKIYNDVLASVLIKIKYFLESDKDCYIKDICDYGNELIKNEIEKIHKGSKRGISLPFTISVNNCIGYYYDNKREIKLEENDIIKIEFGVYIEKCIVNGCDTFLIKDNKLTRDDKYIKFLEKLSEKVIRKILPNNIKVDDTMYLEGHITTDDIRTMIESECTKKECFTLENCTSYQHNKELGLDKWRESKKIILNYKKYYDENNNVIEYNNCDEFENGEVYTIDLSIVPLEEDDIDDIKVYSKEECYIYKFNECYYNLKLKSSKEFYRKIMNNHGKNAFYIKEYPSPKDRMGKKECRDNGILDEYIVRYANKNVYTKKFTIYINNKRCLRI